MEGEGLKVCRFRRPWSEWCGSYCWGPVGNPSPPGEVAGGGGGDDDDTDAHHLGAFGGYQ